MHQYIPGKIVSIESISEKVKLFYWAPADTNFTYNFLPGQFAIIHFPEIESSMPYRSYSIAGLKNGCIEFCISYKDQGEATNVLWSKKPGDYLEVTVAKGEFILQKPITKEVCIIATGTGIAPFKGIIGEILNSSSSTIVYLVYGNRTIKDIIYHEHWLALAKANSQFKYLPVLSQENWDGANGYVHPLYQEVFIDGREAQFYICGWKEMIKEARSNLKKLGYTRKQYFIESYN